MNPAAMIRILVTPAIIYPNKTAVIYPNKVPNLLELKNPRGVWFSRPKIFKRLGKIIREAADRLIRPKVNKKSRAELKGV